MQQCCLRRWIDARGSLCGSMAAAAVSVEFDAARGNCLFSRPLQFEAAAFPVEFNAARGSCISTEVRGRSRQLHVQRSSRCCTFSVLDAAILVALLPPRGLKPVTVGPRIQPFPAELHVQWGSMPRMCIFSVFDAAILDVLMPPGALNWSLPGPESSLFGVFLPTGWQRWLCVSREDHPKPAGHR